MFILKINLLFDKNSKKIIKIQIFFYQTELINFIYYNNFIIR